MDHRLSVVVITLFPQMLRAVTESGVTGRAVENRQLEVSALNPRDFTRDRHRTVDDRPFGGGPGMVMKPGPLSEAVAEAKMILGDPARVIYLSPQGRLLRQSDVKRLSNHKHLILVAGRYEGVDQRFIDTEVDEQWSIGDYVLSGGELPAMVLIDAMARCLPGVLGHVDSADQDSFSGDLEHLLDCPHYTRPEDFRGQSVPEVLLSGHHEQIRQWRHQQTLLATWKKRPELLEMRRDNSGLTAEDEKFLADLDRQSGDENRHQDDESDKQDVD